MTDEMGTTEAQEMALERKILAEQEQVFKLALRRGFDPDRVPDFCERMRFEPGDLELETLLDVTFGGGACIHVERSGGQILELTPDALAFKPGGEPSLYLEYGRRRSVLSSAWGYKGSRADGLKDRDEMVAPRTIFHLTGWPSYLEGLELYACARRVWESFKAKR